ncbi:flavin-dependent oxidoreductase [Amycolatopsis circi]|uniref:flavin-dependent oxidoreductase n=1 Tax=Amycolatopsis circi TaxID=871959 RepID=UPI000E225E1B|nr:flavin-dependent oxidoreductase [Amycolatopsis circi]
MRIAIAGAGIGGLTAALSLADAGFTDVTVYEAAPRIDPLGAGLNLLPNAVRELFGLGLGTALDKVSVRTGNLEYRNRFGTLIWREPRGVSAGYRWPQLSVHRGLLQAVLLAAVRERLGANAVRAGTRVTGFTRPSSGTARVELSHGPGVLAAREHDLLVGADGIRSTVRKVMHRGDPGPRWNGLMVWRGNAWAQPFLDGATMVIVGDRVRRVVVYPMSRPVRPGEPVLMNWAVARKLPDGQPADPADWNRPAPADRFLPYFADLVFDWLDVPALVRSGNRALEYPMVDHDPLPSWTSGRVTLLGDAAHAMYPMGSNGATQSIVDSRVLARALAGHTGTEDALRAYESARRPAMTALQAAGRRRGPEAVIDLADERAPDGFADAAEVFAPGELATISRRYATLGAFDLETVNSPARAGNDRRGANRLADRRDMP